MNDLNSADFLISSESRNKKPTRNQISTRFLGAKIPAPWLVKADSLGPAAFVVGIAVWDMQTLRRSLCFRASLKDLSQLIPLSEQRARRGLKLLESAGLITVVRKPGCKLEITIALVEISK
jgi:hypothetical protein